MKKCHSLILAAFLGLTGMVSGRVQEVYAQNLETKETKYVGYEYAGCVGNNLFSFKLNIIPFNTLQEIHDSYREQYDEYVDAPEELEEICSESEIVYCMDPGKNAPGGVKNKPLNTWAEYSAYIDITEEEIKQSCRNKEDPQDIMKSLAWIAENGYPNGSSEIRGNLTDDEFRSVTQWAVYYATTGESYKNIPSFFLGKELEVVAKKLTPTEYPEDFDFEKALKNATIYTPKSGVFQCLFQIRKTNPSISFAKVNAKGIQIAGAEIEILRANGDEEIVESWTTVEGTSKEIRLAPGDYIFRETKAPEGYLCVEDIEFTVDDEGKVSIKEENETEAAEVVDNTLFVTDEQTYTVKFSKQDVAGEELKDAKIKLTNADGEIVEEWTSNGKTREIKLTAGTYRFEETAAPEGYEIATSITVVIDKDGKITSSDVTVKGDDENLIVMVDNVKPTPTATPSSTPTPTPSVVQTPTPASNTPSTGVHANTGMWVAMGVSLIVFAGLFVVRKKLVK